MASWRTRFRLRGEIFAVVHEIRSAIRQLDASVR
jgi:hypothetical protein